MADTMSLVKYARNRLPVLRSSTEVVVAEPPVEVLPKKPARFVEVKVEELTRDRNSTMSGPSGLAERILRRQLSDQQSKEEMTNKHGKYNPRMLVIIPAWNEAHCIRDGLEGLADQELPEGVDMDILVMADNCEDNTAQVAEKAGKELGLNLEVRPTVNNEQHKVGAHNQAWAQAFVDEVVNWETIPATQAEEDYRDSVQAIIAMDADSRFGPGALIKLWKVFASAPNKIGAVSPIFIPRIPKSKRKLDSDDPHYKEKIESGQYGGAITRWWAAMQNHEFTAWQILTILARGDTTYVNGGQGSLFNAKVLREMVDGNERIDSPWDTESEVEDMHLTWRIQEMEKETIVCPGTRCYVDPMRSYHTLQKQRAKWDGGQMGLLREKANKTIHKGLLWRQQARISLDFSVRVIFYALLAVALSTGQFVWEWIWITPLALASVLNTMLALKSPQHRTIDVIYAATVVTPEVYTSVRISVWARAWVKQFSVQRSSAWAAQYDAQEGKTKSKLGPGLMLCAMLAAGAVYAAIHFSYYLTSHAVQYATRPYVHAGYVVLTVLTILTILIMVRQIFVVWRTPYRV